MECYASYIVRDFFMVGSGVGWANDDAFSWRVFVLNFLSCVILFLNSHAYTRASITQRQT
jgi:hypothetical protein